MQISKRGLELIESFEGFSSVQYNDGTGVITIGYGTTSADVWPLPTHLSRQQAEDLLARKIAEKYGPAVAAVHPANQNQFDALCSFAYNLGPGSMAWDVGRETRAGNYGAAANALLQYDRAGGQVLLGLQRRRQAERALYLTPVVDPYAIYSRDSFKLPDSNRRIIEVDRVKYFDQLAQHPIRNAVALRPVRHDLAFLRDRILVAADLDPKGRAHGLAQYNRALRWHKLYNRTGNTKASVR